MSSKYEVTKEQLDALRGEHGDIGVCETIAGTLVFRRPTRPEFKTASKAGLMDAKNSPEAFELLARATCVSPGRQALDSALETYPALAMQCGEELLRLAGMTGEDLGKKLFRW